MTQSHLHRGEPDISMVRVCHGATVVAGVEAPWHTVHYRLFYPATYSATDAERLTGNIPADPAKAPWPVAIVLPGVNVGPDGYRWLAIALAEAGIATLTYTFVTQVMTDIVGISPGLDLTAVEANSYGTRPSATAIGPLIEALNEHHKTGPLAGLLDLDQIVLIGHSAGGTVALENANPTWFPGVRAAISYGSHTMPALALGHPGGTVLAVPSEVPVLIMVGDHDGVIARSVDRYGADPAAHDPVRRTFREGVSRSAGDCYRVVLRDGTHLSMLDPLDPTTARGFLDPHGPCEAEVRQEILLLIRSFCQQALTLPAMSSGSPSGSPAAMIDALLDHRVAEWECR